eukprot:757424-Hanusia_phi.AAC.2
MDLEGKIVTRGGKQMYYSSTLMHKMCTSFADLQTYVPIKASNNSKDNGHDEQISAEQIPGQTDEQGHKSLKQQYFTHADRIQSLFALMTS